MKSTLFLLSILSLQVHAFNDTFFDKQWGVKNTGQTLLRRSGELTRDEIKGIPGKDINYVNFKDVHPEVPADREVVVAVLDSGIDADHPDLKGRIHFDKELCPNEDDIKDKPCSGINILKKSFDLTDDVGHGTHVAGIIAAVSDNQLGIAGVADSRIKILPIKVLAEDTSDFVYNGRVITDIFADGIVFAIQRGASVINMSIGWPKLVETPKMKRALEIAAQRNIVIVAAAGNNNKQIPTYPCTSEEVICVGAVDNQGKITEFSNFGGKVDILAPGEFIVSTYPRDSVESRILRIRGYETKNGTSQASPYVAAIAASLKLIDPQMTLKEVKARLYDSAHPRKESEFEGKFSKYGLINMKKALESAPKKFASPVYKDLLDLNFKHSDGSFFFSLPIESLKGEFNSLKVKVEFDRDDIVLEENQYELSLKEGAKRSVLVKGKLTDLNKDTHFGLTVHLEDEGFVSTTQTTLIFARDMAREGGATIHNIEGFKDSELTFFQGVRKVSRVKKVRLSENTLKAPSYYTEVPELNDEERTTLSFLKRKEENWVREDITLEKRHEIVSVTSLDLNLNGLSDLLVVGVSKDQRFVTFDYLLENKKLTFQFPILEYKNFPLEYTSLGSTNLISVTFKGQRLLVPSFYAAYYLPEEDNSQDILDRVPADLVAPHQYYLEPISEEGVNRFRLRVLDSLEVVDTFRQQFFIESWQGLSFDSPFPQGEESLQKGILKGLVTVGEEFARDYYLYTYEQGKLSFERVFFPDRLLAGNNTRQLLSVQDNTFGQVTNDVEFLAQLKRDQVRSYVWSPDSKVGQSLIIDTSKWSDPIFNSITAFNDEQTTRLIETRYYLRAYGKDGELGRLRINRESSFPGVQFSETLNPIMVKSEEQVFPGLFINSTLIFGNRLYSMVQKEGEFLRPLKFSVDIPSQCVHLKPERFDDVYHYVMLCRKSGGKITLETLPLVME